MNTQKLLGVGMTVLALVFGLYGAFRPAKVVEKETTKVVGSVSTLDGVDNPYVSIGGVKEWHGSQNLAATSTQICRVKNPFLSTSTVVYASLDIATGMLGTNKVSLGTSTAAQNGFGTSTTYLVFEHSVTSLAKDSIVWAPNISTTTNVNLAKPTVGTGEAANIVLAPGEYLVWSIGTTTATSVNASYYAGTCKSVIRAFN